jgi:flagellar biosynthesis/type III secretory pathway M-ring protein FliF/YscJ
VEYLIVLVVVAVVVSAISAPLRTARAQTREPTGADQVAELEAARDAKYREIRDAELDVRTGKLSDADYATLDSTLRAEAITILNALDEAREQVPSAP